jgi:hypothetical protein
VRLVFTPHGWNDYTYWLAADRATLMRIDRLIDDALRDPSTGIGKPELLRHMLAVCGPGGSAKSIAWSSRGRRRPRDLAGIGVDVTFNQSWRE